MDVEGEGPIFKIVQTKLISEDKNNVVSTTLTSGVQNCGRMLEQMIQCIDFAVGPPCLTFT